MRPWRMSKRELTPATSLPHGGHFGLMSSTSVPDGETGGRLALDLLFLGQWPLARCPVPDALKLRSFMVHWSPALSCGEHIRVPLESCVSELFCPGGAMALSGIGFGGQEGQRCPVSMMDGEPGRRVVLGPHRPQASVLQPGAHPSSALKLRSSPARWSPALSCVSFSSQAGPLALTGIVSSSAQVGPMALSGIDGKPGGRVVLGPHRPQASVLQPGAHPPGVLKLNPPWHPGLLLSCVSFSSQAGPLALTGIDGETGERLVLGLFLGLWPSAWCPAPDALRLRPFLAPWSPTLSCDGEPGGRLVLSPHRPQASVCQPGAHPLVC
ncbi:uncharacterized protein [Macaca nemestrina]|uniref:uncharacterized protein isoform X3 n=1 Tax=Macaca nemestrina TaxID=9545 RepID=UPI0039B86530